MDTGEGSARNIPQKPAVSKAGRPQFGIGSARNAFTLEVKCR
jgi:hypothetical protein